MEDLLTFAKEGLRTLVVAQKQISEDVFFKLEDELRKIKLSSSNDKDSLLNEVYSKHETGLTYVGSTAIEDKL